MTDELRIWEPKESGDCFYVFEDVAELLWPGTFDHSNHSAEERITERMIAKGCTTTMQTFTSPQMAHTGYVTPAGVVAFDSESGMFECHSPERGPVEYVVSVIQELGAEYTTKREEIA